MNQKFLTPRDSVIYIVCCRFGSLNFTSIFYSIRFFLDFELLFRIWLEKFISIDPPRILPDSSFPPLLLFGLNCENFCTFLYKLIVSRSCDDRRRSSKFGLASNSSLLLAV